MLGVVDGDRVVDCDCDRVSVGVGVGDCVVDTVSLPAAAARRGAGGATPGAAAPTASPKGVLPVKQPRGREALTAGPEQSEELNAANERLPAPHEYTPDWGEFGGDRHVLSEGRMKTPPGAPAAGHVLPAANRSMTIPAVGSAKAPDTHVALRA